MVKAVRSVSPRLFIDAHLMIENPMQYLDPFVKAGVDSLTIHAEAVDNLPRALAAMRRAGIRVGVSIRPKTPLRVIEDVLDRIDMVLIMTVEPGFGGQEMLPNTINKVRQLARRREKDHLKYLIQVDGGINPKTVGIAVAAGANAIVAGSAVFGGNHQIAQNLAALTQAALEMNV
jgi:ribulose-phosphate 3-epimerase